MRGTFFDGNNAYFCWSITLRLVLELGYIAFVYPVFISYGFDLDFNGLKYAESWGIYILLLAIFPKQLSRPSDYLLAYLLYSFLLPLLIFYALVNETREHLYWVLLGVACLWIAHLGSPFAFATIRGGPQIAFCIALVGAIAVTVWMIGSGGLNNFNLDFSKVYDYRDQANTVLNKGLMSYLIIWAGKVFGPFLLALALWKRHYVFVPLLLLLHVIWFGISSHKGILFYPLLVIFVWLWVRTTGAIAVIAAAMTAMVLLSLLAYLVIGDTWLGALLIRRVFFVPSLLTFKYYEFFSQNELVFWSNSILSAFREYPYDVNTARVIGQYLGGNANANNSFLATGYMHAGVAGVVFYGVLVGMLFRLIDSVANRGVPTWVAVAVITIPGESLLSSSDLPTALLTHGMGISLLLMALNRVGTCQKLKLGEQRSTITQHHAT